MKGKHVLKFTERKYTYFVMILAGELSKNMYNKATELQESWEKKSKKDKHCLHHSVERMA